MKIKFLRSYRSKNGNTTFVYVVNGTQAQLTEFKEIQGDYFRESDDGKALWFTTRYCGEIASLVLTGGDNPRYIPDMSAFEKAASLSKQFGGDLGQELAKQAAAELLSTNPTTQSAVQTTQPVPDEVPADIPQSTGVDDIPF